MSAGTGVTCEDMRTSARSDAESNTDDRDGEGGNADASSECRTSPALPYAKLVAVVVGEAGWDAVSSRDMSLARTSGTAACKRI